MLPPALGNAGPPYRTVLTVRPGPRRVTDDGERARYYIAPGNREAARRRYPPVDLRRCRNILVVKLDFIGDWVLTTPFVANLRRNAPKAKITVVVLDRAFDLAVACSFVDRVVSIASAESRRVVFGAATPTALAGFRRDYIGGAFDLAVVPRWDADFNGALQIAHGSGAPRIVGFSERSTRRKRRLNRGDDCFYTDALVDVGLRHEGERELALIEAMGGAISIRRPILHTTTADRVTANSKLRHAFRQAARPFLAVAPFGSEAKKTLPAPLFAATIRRISGVFGLGVVVLGSPGNVSAAADFAKMVGENAIPAADLTTRQAAAVIARAVAFIGMDSGPAHIAAGVGTPAAVLFCHPADGAPDHTYSPVRFAPLGRQGEVLVIQPETARPPCRGGCEASEAHCILELTEEVLWPKLSAFIASRVPAETPINEVA